MCAGCKPGQALDIAFIVDDKLGGSGNKRRLYELISGVIDKLDIDDDGTGTGTGGNSDVRISFIRECATVPEMRLSRYYDKNAMLDHLERTRPVLERTPGLLRAATNKLSDSVRDIFHENEVIAEQGRQKIAVYITNGESRDLEATLREAQVAKLDNDISIIGVGVGEEVNLVELRALVSCEPENFLHTGTSHDDLIRLQQEIARNICQGELVGRYMENLSVES